MVWYYSYLLIKNYILTHTIKCLDIYLVVILFPENGIAAWTEDFGSTIGLTSNIGHYAFEVNTCAGEARISLMQYPGIHLILCI